MTITRRTRKNLFDWLSVERVKWSGRLEESQFLARIYDLEELPSNDRRFDSAAGDIWQHRVNNSDWEDDWVYSDERFELLDGPDEVLLIFLAEMLHPVVRPDIDEARTLASTFSDFLREDGYALVPRTQLGGKPVWAGESRSLAGTAALPAVRSARETFNADYILRQITRMEAGVETDPALAIGTAKELVESTCKAILEARSVPTSGREDMPELVRLVTRELRLAPGDVGAESRDPDTVRRILGSLGTLAGGVSELRNAYGTGHGRSPSASGLGPRHARLATGSASTLAVFLWETHGERD